MTVYIHAVIVHKENIHMYTMYRVYSILIKAT